MQGEKVIKTVMSRRGFRVKRQHDRYAVHGDYARHLQLVYSKTYPLGSHDIIDMVFLGVDMHREVLVVGFFREDPKMEHGVMENRSVSIRLARLSEKELDRVLNGLIRPVK